MIPGAGVVVLLTARCGAQFRSPLKVRVIRTYRFGSTPDHMVYLAGYVLDDRGNAIERRDMLLIEHAGLEPVEQRPAAARQARNAGPPQIPRQRKPSSSQPHPVRQEQTP